MWSQAEHPGSDQSRRTRKVTQQSEEQPSSARRAQENRNKRTQNSVQRAPKWPPFGNQDFLQMSHLDSETAALWACLSFTTQSVSRIWPLNSNPWTRPGSNVGETFLLMGWWTEYNKRQTHYGTCYTENTEVNCVSQGGQRSVSRFLKYFYS